MQIIKVDSRHIEQIHAIYNHYVKSTAITFEYDMPNLITFTKRVKKISETYPFFVLTDQNNAVIGYAYANRFRERKAYDYIAESSVYLKHTEQRKGGGKMLYEALLNELKSIGIKEVIGVVTLPNKSSEKFHLKTGFVKSGTIKRAGIKFEKWWDIALYQKSL